MTYKGTLLARKYELQNELRILHGEEINSTEALEVTAGFPWTI